MAGLDQAAQAGDGHAAGGLGEDALALGEQADALNHLFVADGGGGAPGFGHRTQSIVAVRGVANRQGLGDGVGLNRPDALRALLPGRDDRRAALRLAAGHLGLDAVNQAQLGQLIEAFADLHVERARGHRHDAVVGGAPAQLLGDFIAQGLGALGVVGAHVDVDEGPGVLVADLGAEAVDVVVGALDSHQVGAVNLRAQQLAFFQVRGHEDEGLHARPRGVGADRVGQVAGGGAGQGVVAELPRLGGGHGHDAVLERPCGVGAVVLKVEVLQAQVLGQVLGADQGCEAGLEVDGLALAGQQVTIAPDGQRPALDALAADGLAHALVVVGDLQGAEAELADVLRGYGVFAAALAALEASGERHERCS